MISPFFTARIHYAALPHSFVLPFLFLFLLFLSLFPSTLYILSYFYLSCQLLFCEVIYNLLLIHPFSMSINTYPSYLLLIIPTLKISKFLLFLFF